MLTEKVNIRELADVIRSKNAGPYELSFDIVFKSFEIYEQVKQSGVFTEELIADLYNVSVDEVISLINYDAAKAIKATIIRPRSAGAVGEGDVYGAQQHAPLLGIEIEI